LGRAEDHAEVQEIRGQCEGDTLVVGLVANQKPNGSWSVRQSYGASAGGSFLATSYALSRLGYLGFGPDFAPVRKGAEYLFSKQRRDGSWPIPQRAVEEQGRYSMVPLQTALPLRGLAASGYATDPRAEKAYEWLLAQRLPDGAWPSGKASGTFGYVAGYRKLPHSRWGCRSNTTGALLCLAHHPSRNRSPEAGRALDLLLGRQTEDRHALGFEVARLIGVEPVRGLFTHYARFDAAMVLVLCRSIGADLSDARVLNLAAFVAGEQGIFGLWEYARDPRASAWITFDLLSSLEGLDKNRDWLNMEPPTPFQTYGKRRKRY
jgi:hypothetical protein